jgi:hypothetical protein
MCLNNKTVNFPHHRYLGPGNELNNQPHLDKDDFIAKIHDNAYDKNPSDVHQEDYIAANEFYNEAKNSPHAIVGAVGLGAKFIAEQFVGQLYPMNKRQHPDRSDYSETESQVLPPETPRKKPAGVPATEGTFHQTTPNLDEFEQFLTTVPKVDSTAAPVGNVGSTTMSGSGGSSTEPGGTGTARIRIKSAGINKFSMTASRKFTVTTTNFANRYFAAGVMPQALRLSLQEQHLLMPLYVLNPNNLYMYMTPEEFDALPKYCWATKCRIKATCVNYRTNFETQSTRSTSVNSQQPVECQYAIGLNTYLTMGHGKPTLPQNSVVPSGISLDSFEGSAINTVRMNEGIRTLQEPPLAYAAYFLSGQNLDKYVTRENMIQCKGQPLVNYEYNFKVSPLKTIRNPWSVVTPTSAPTNIMGQITPMTISQTGVNGLNGFTTQANVNFLYSAGIEKCKVLCMETENSHTTGDVPMIYIGGPAILSSMPGASNATFGNCFLTWVIETELHIECNINLMDKFGLIPGMQPMFYDRLSQVNLASGYHNNSTSGHQFVNIAGYAKNAHAEAVAKEFSPVITDLDKKCLNLSHDLRQVKRKIEDSLKVQKKLHENWQTVLDDIEAKERAEARKNQSKRETRDYQPTLAPEEGVLELFDIQNDSE